MSGKHRDAGQERSGAPVAAVARRSAGAVWFPASLGVAFAAFGAAVVVAQSEPEAPRTEAAPSAYTVTAPQAVNQQGTVVAVTADSITTRSDDGSVQTFRVTPDTTAVTYGGGAPYVEVVPFDVNDVVTVQGTVSGGQATATAVADQAVIGQYGVPMDSN